MPLYFRNVKEAASIASMKEEDPDNVIANARGRILHYLGRGGESATPRPRGQQGGCRGGALGSAERGAPAGVCHVRRRPMESNLD